MNDGKSGKMAIQTGADRQDQVTGWPRLGSSFPGGGAVIGCPRIPMVFGEYRFLDFRRSENCKRREEDRDRYAMTREAEESES